MKSAIVCFLWGILFFIGFAVDIEYDRDFMTWMWLLTSIIWFMMAFRYRILDDNR